MTAHRAPHTASREVPEKGALAQGEDARALVLEEASHREELADDGAHGHRIRLAYGAEGAALRAYVARMDEAARLLRDALPTVGTASPVRGARIQAWLDGCP